MSLIRSRPGRKSLVTSSEGKALRSSMDGMRRLAAARLGEADFARLRAYVRVGARGRGRELADEELVDLVAGHILLRPAIVATLGARSGVTRNPRWQALEAAAAKVLTSASALAEEEEPIR